MFITVAKLVLSSILFKLDKLHAIEPCTRTARSSRIVCSRRGHRIVYLAVKMGIILVNILFLKIFFANH